MPILVSVRLASIDLIYVLSALVQRPIFDGIRLDAVHTRNPWLRLLAECVAELLGTAILVLFGCSGIAQYTLSRGVLSSFLSVNFAFGFGAMIAVYVAGPISGSARLSLLPSSKRASFRCSHQSGCVHCHAQSTIHHAIAMRHVHSCAYV